MERMASFETPPYMISSSGTECFEKSVSGQARRHRSMSAEDPAATHSRSAARAPATMRMGFFMGTSIAAIRGHAASQGLEFGFGYAASARAISALKSPTAAAGPPA